MLASGLVESKPQAEMAATKATAARNPQRGEVLVETCGEAFFESGSVDPDRRSAARLRDVTVTPSMTASDARLRASLLPNTGCGGGSFGSADL